MTLRPTIHLKVSYKWIAILLFTFAISLLNAIEARAERCVADLGGVVDGFVTPNPPSQIQIDGNCIIRNFPASNPLSANFSFYTSPGQTDQRWLIVFDNVVHTGNISCNTVQGHHIWFTNSSSTTVRERCLNLLIAVEKINKQNPAGQTTATIGVPFTYKLTIPVMFDPATGTVINANGSPNDLHGITVWDDLNATGADLSFVSERAYWLNGGAAVSHTFSNVGGKLTFDNFPVVPAGQQFVIEVTVVLRDTPANVPGTQFVNTAKWDFGRLIDGVYYEPLPGEWGVTPPMTIATPVLAVTKSGPPTMNLGQWGNFALDIRNTGTSDAWNVTLRDQLPHGATGGMCDLAPEIVSAQVFAADGVTPVTGKGPLIAGSDYSLSYSAAPTCRLDITILSAAARIGRNERLIIRYRTQLDSNTQNGVTLTNIAGATQWFNDSSSNPNRKSSTRTLTNGTPGTLDHEDAFTVTVAVSGYSFEKTVADLTSGANPATQAAPGDKLRYTLRFRNSQALNNFRIVDELDALNAQAYFAPGTLALVTVPTGADISATSGTGGTKGTGVIDISNLNLPGGSGEILIQFDITLKSAIANGTVVANQSTLGLASTTTFALSDDPNVNGPADPTRVTIVAPATSPAFRVLKISTDRTGDPSVLLSGDTLRYTITVKNTGSADAVNVVLRDLVPANTTYVAGSTTMNGAAVPDIAGVSPLVNGMRINTPANTTPGSMPADASSNPVNVATITFDVVVSQVLAGTVISNQGFVTAADSGIVNQPSDDPGTPAPNDPTLNTVVAVNPAANAPALVVTKSGPALMSLGQWGNFVVDVQNTGQTDAWNAIVRDLLPLGAMGGMCNLTPEILSAQVFAPDGVTPAPGKGPLNSGSGYSLSYSIAPNCQLEIMMLTAAGAIGPNERLIIRYRTQLDANTQNGVKLTNVAGATQWFDGDSSYPNRKSYTRTLTNGTPAVVDHQDAFTVTVSLSGYLFEKTVADLTSGANPATTAAPGDKLRYMLRFRTTNQAFSDFRIVDELDALNAQPYFAPGTLTLVGFPTGADISATSGTGGARGTGLIDIHNLSLPAGGSEVLIQFDITLKSGIANGAVVTNQSTLRLANGTTLALSDDPNVNGAADPTVVRIVSPATAPAFRVQKISTDMTGDPNVLLPGETLRYTITVKNITTTDAVNVMLRDAIPANTTYVAGSTTLNGAAVADLAGVSPLVNGMMINSPANSMPGSMPADASSNPANVATITFDVVVNQNVANGTAISNQGFVTAAGSGVVDQPSDDPRTPALNDPTINIVSNLNAPVLVVAKSGPATMNLGQWGNFAIDVRNTGAIDAWNATLRDLLPHGTTGGMCDLTPEILSAQVFAADGVTPVPGKGALSANSDYSHNYSVAPTCQLDITMLTAAGRIGPNERLIVRYRTQLDNNTQSGVTLTNIAGATQWFDADSSNPNRKSSTRTLTNGTPGTLDHEDAHTVTVGVPAFRVQKISTDMTGDPNVLLAGETLRYRITVKNISNSDVVNVRLRDAVPANTTYVAGSTTLNGAPVADVAGVSPLVNGMLINSPANTTPGSMPADASSNPANVATITFDVVINANVAGGTAISNQGFVSGNGTVDQPSDDPRTPALNDPTIDIVGNRPRLYADKRAALSGDRGSPGIVDPGDVLRYTISITNSSAIPATGVVLTDAVPANTTYVAGSSTLNGAAVADVGGGSPLASGITIGSSGQAAGTIAPGATAVLQYDLSVNVGTPAGTQISNQAVVISSGQPSLLTDGDGNPATGPEPTVVIVGAGQQVSITNQVSVVGGGAAVPGAQLDYVVNVVNTATVPAYNVVVTDDLNAPQPGRLSYVNGSATMNGAAAGVSFAGSTITLNYGAVNGPLAPGAAVVLRFRATLNSNLVLGTVVTNTSVVTWNNPPETKSASVSLAVGSIPAPGVPVLAELNGTVWYDAGFDEVPDSGERALAGWAVELYRDNQLLQSVVTDANGVYRIPNVPPNDVTRVRYELRFRAPGAGPNTAMLGRAASPFTNGLQRISDIIVPSGANLRGLNLPVHPNGVIYNSSTRAPIAGATLTLLDVRSNSPLPASCLDDAAQQGQITLADGYYKFDVNFSNPACPSSGDYLIGLTAPSGMNYVAGYSQIIPPKSSASTAAFSVPACAGSAADAIPRTTIFCEVQTSEFAPGASVPPRSAGTNYHVHVKLDGSQMPGTSQIFNNHIPLDPQILGSLSISKTTPMLNVSRGQLVPYVITVNNRAGQLVPDVTIVDRLPAGFTYIVGSALLDGVPTEPSVVGRELSWNSLTVGGTQVRTVRLLIAVGAGVTEGEFVNRAQAMNLVTGNPLSGEATATVRLVPDATFDCNDVTGKVFNDANRNGRQEDGEDGLAGVRVVTAQGLQATTDQYGRYHITCAITPNEIRGSNFVLKLDDRTLPSGFRMSTDQIQIERATRGKALRVNFGASIQRVVGIDLSDAAFEPGTTEIRVQWKPRLNLLLEELHKSPALLRLSYVADTEDEALVKRRVEAVKRQLTGAWDAEKNSPGLTIEHEVFWRRGAPSKRPDVPGRR